MPNLESQVRDNRPNNHAAAAIIVYEKEYGSPPHLPYLRR